MDETLLAVAHANGGYLMRHQLLDLAIDDSLIRKLMRAGLLVRVRHGTYVPAASWSRMTDGQKHAVLARSVVDRLGPGVVLSHQSAAAVHGMDLWGVDLTTVHVTRLDDRNGRSEAGVVFHSGRLSEEECVEVDGRVVTKADRTALETSAAEGIEEGVVLLSSAMRLGLVVKEELEERLDRDFARWQGVRTARISIRLADGRLESVGEARSMYMFWKHRLPAPELQVDILDREGRRIGRCDFYWSLHRHMGEFDGILKYHRLNPYADDPGHQIELEKVREDRMRATDRGMTRWIWSGLGSAGAATARRIEVDMERSRRLFTRGATHVV